MTPRSRLFITLGVVGFALALLLRDSLAGLVVIGAAFAVATVSSFTRLTRMTDVSRHPAAFKVTGGRFAGTPMQSYGEAVMMMLVLLGNMVASMLRNFEDPDPVVSGPLAWTMLGVSTAFGVLFVTLAALAWRADAYPVELTPEGVVSRTFWDRQTIPWEALAPGGPLRPRPFEARTRLVVTRPELVRRSRFRLPGVGNSVPAFTGTHPWFVADAIRWYVEHAEDRAAIGTEAEHERLVTALGADSLAQAAPAVPRPPAVVKVAIRLGYAGVAFGLLTALADVALAFGLSDRLKAHAVELAERDYRDFGVEPGDPQSGVYFHQAWQVFILVAMAILSVVVVLALRALKRGNPAGWISVIVVSAVAVLWAANPCFDLAFSEPPADLALVVYGVTALKRLGYIGLGVATGVLLLMPSARDFAKPKVAVMA